MEQDRIQAALAEKRKPGLVVRRLGGMKGMASLLTGRGVPREIRSVVEEGFSMEGFSRFTLVAKRRGELGPLLEKLSEDDWRQLIEQLIPQYAPSALAAWRALARRPFQQGLSRKPFRSPNVPARLADLRGRWLLNVTLLLGEYEADITWVAAHAAHLAGWSGATDIGWLLAGALDVGDETSKDVQRILEASATGQHETAQMGRHVIQAMLSSGCPEAWGFIERLLLAAQRQEGVRQAILESVDESHPDAFRRMLRLIREENLSRFSSVVRAADTWFGFMWDGSSAVKIDSILERVSRMLDDPDARRAGLDDADPETVYLALWSAAFENIDAAVPLAVSRLSSSSADVRFVATHLLVQSLWSSALPPLVDMLCDADLRVAARALDVFGTDVTSYVDGGRLFTNLEALIARAPKRTTTLDAIVWPWSARKLERSRIASAMSENVSAVKGERLLPYVPDLAPSAREGFIRQAAGLASKWAAGPRPSPRGLSRAERTIVLELLGDASADVRLAAFEALRGSSLGDDEVERLVELLARKPGDLRNGCIARLRTLPKAKLLRVADALLADASEERRTAGLELLRDAVESGRASDEVRARVERYSSRQADSLSEAERLHVAAALGEPKDVDTTENALGLIDRSTLRRWPRPTAKPVEVESRASRATIESLAALVLSHAETEIRTASGETRLLTESVPWNIGPRRLEQVDHVAEIPLAEVWRRWLNDRPSDLRDPDGLEFVRALMCEQDAPTWKSNVVKQVVQLGQYSAGGRFLRALVEWCLVWDPPAGVAKYLLDGFEKSLSAFTDAEYRALADRAAQQLFVQYIGIGEKRPSYAIKVEEAQKWVARFHWWSDLFPGFVTGEDHVRLYGLLRTFEARGGANGYISVDLRDFVAARASGAVSDEELIDLLVGPNAYRRGMSLLRSLSTRRPPKGLTEQPELQAIIDRCRRRIVDVETQRGDRTTAVSGLAMELRWTGGLETVSAALPALGKSHFARAFSWSGKGESRQETLSHLVLRSVPREEDTPEAFAAWARGARVSEARLVELAVYAPQWATHVSEVLGWRGLESAVWWIQAHTKDDRSWQLSELKEIWAAQVSERTPLAASDLTEGAVDVSWFRTAYQELGTKRWKLLDTAAKYAASSAGHTRAQLFARAMAGLVTREEILERIDKSRHQDSVRALGLLPLAEGDAGREDLLTRYKRLQEFRRESRKFGSQRQQSEGRAVAIGLENLARTAGYRDPQRLQWAMEQEAVADLARGPATLERDGVTLTLSVDSDGVPSLATVKNGKSLKSLPAALKKDAEVAALKERLQDLKRQRSRVRDALETAMCRGDVFTPDELRTLLAHPILSPALSRLVLVGDDVAGYLVEKGRALRDHSGALHALGNHESLRVAHPHDLYASGGWSAWQRECFAAERVQPFKQLFRELYPLTETELGTERTRRFAGHQVNPRQALALLGGRGWVARPEEGVSRTFHEIGLTVRLGFEEAFFTPADIEGLTLDEVIFTRKGEWKPMPLAEIPPRAFSEAMRDLDLVVSVAHQGGVDPEATASTVEMRAALVAETCALLGITNVELKTNHAIVRGEHGTYSIHLGSAGVSLVPGTALAVVAVHSQHRGRLFLPFADDDPRTAEVLSKVLLLARDKEIRDPNILELIRAAHRGSIV